MFTENLRMWAWLQFVSKEIQSIKWAMIHPPTELSYNPVMVSTGSWNVFIRLNACGFYACKPDPRDFLLTVYRKSALNVNLHLDRWFFMSYCLPQKSIRIKIFIISDFCFYMFYNTDFVLFKTPFLLFIFLLLLFLQISENPGTPTFPLNDTPVRKIDFTTSWLCTEALISQISQPVE